MKRHSKNPEILILGLWLVLLLALLSSGCGYSWGNKTNPWAAKNVRRVYIRTFTNNSLESGIEVPVTSALIKEFARGGRLKVVDNEKDADAFIEGSINGFSSTINSYQSVTQTTNDPAAQALSDMVVAAEYVAKADFGVKLVKKDGGVLWLQQFSRTKIYPAGNRFGLPGSTSALINASQEQIALNEIAQFIASDIYDTMLEAF